MFRAVLKILYSLKWRTIDISSNDFFEEFGINVLKDIQTHLLV